MPEALRNIFEKEFVYIKGFLRNVKRFGGWSALTCPMREKTWTYRELNSEVNKLSNTLLDAGVSEGDVVTYMLTNIAEFVFFYLATQKIGVVNNPINYRLAPGEVAYILDECPAKVFAYEAQLVETVQKALEMAKKKPEILVRVETLDSDSSISGDVVYREFVKSSSDKEPYAEDDIPSRAFSEVTRLHTSGTTGLPKVVPLTNLNEILSAHDVIMHYPLSPTDKTMNLTPWFHRGGLYSGGPNPTLYVGAQLVSLRTFDPVVALNYIEKYKITFITGAPITARMLLEEHLKNPRDLSSLKGLCTMGAPLDRSFCIELMENITPNIMNGYGTTETFWNTFLRPFDLPQRAGAAGRSCTDDKVKVVKLSEKPNTDNLVERNNEEVGEVITKSLKFSYWYINPRETEKKVHNDWYFTGDLATWDQDGCITIVGRKDDMIISGGENIYPVQIEEALAEHPKVTDLVVVGVPDERWGEICTAYVVPKEPIESEVEFAKELDEFCKKHLMLSDYKRPRYYKFIEALPLTATGKKKHYKIRELASEDKKMGKLIRV
ncbi:MAG: AMP-binding protein [Deltaproteobacteria bacterium]|nr:AMP-binding protein [Deltaproteobacteria bacterium]RLB87579.1 MAG: long-chain fatty acid--CoA ligase [Deltaproteobacteria bacterium]RLC09909.1 MAG: long-chain fatty acid--CoA ligase [Deltaproteobacteria bacterium]